MTITSILKNLVAMQLMLGITFGPTDTDTVTPDIKPAEEAAAELLDNPEEAEATYESEDIMTVFFNLEDTYVNPDIIEVSETSYNTSSFNDRYIFAHLSPAQQSVYTAIYNEIGASSSQDFQIEDSRPYICAVDCTSSGLSNEDIWYCYSAVYYDSPEYFWIGDSAVGEDQGRKIIYIYARDGYASLSRRNSVQQTLNSVINEVKPLVDSKETIDQKYKAIVDYICNRCEYPAPDITGNFPEDSGTIVALETCAPICGGYSKIFTYLARSNNLPATSIIGYVYPDQPGYHAWNAVPADGYYYYVDVTFRDGGDPDAFLGGAGAYAIYMPLSPGFHENYTVGFPNPTISDISYYERHPMKYQLILQSNGAVFPDGTRDMYILSDMMIGTTNNHDLSSLTPFFDDMFYFCGWDDQYGNQVYDESGNAVLGTMYWNYEGIYVYNNDLTLYSVFALKPSPSPSPSNTNHSLTLMAKNATFKDGTRDKYTIKDMQYGSSNNHDISHTIPYFDEYNSFRGWIDQYGNTVYDENGIAINGSEYWDNEGLYTYNDDLILYGVFSPKSNPVTPTPTPVPVSSDTIPPTLNSTKIERISSDGFTINICASDNAELASVSFSIWTDNNGTDDRLTHTYTDTDKTDGEGEYYTHKVFSSDHNNESGLYHIQIILRDSSDNTYEWEDTLSIPPKADMNLKFNLLVKEKYNLLDHLTIDHSKNYKFVICNRKYISINKKGVITAKKAGTTKILVYEKDKPNASAVTTIDIHILKPVVTPIILTHPGETVALSNEVLNIPAEKTCYWSITKGNGSIAMIYENDLIACNTSGSGKIQAFIVNEDGYSVKCTLPLKTKIPKITSPKNVRVGKMATLRIKNVPKTSTVIWETETPGISIIQTNSPSKIKIIVSDNNLSTGIIKCTVDGYDYYSSITIK